MYCKSDHRKGISETESHPCVSKNFSNTKFWRQFVKFQVRKRKAPNIITLNRVKPNLQCLEGARTDFYVVTYMSLISAFPDLLDSYMCQLDNERGEITKTLTLHPNLKKHQFKAKTDPHNRNQNGGGGGGLSGKEICKYSSFIFRNKVLKTSF